MELSGLSLSVWPYRKWCLLGTGSNLGGDKVAVACLGFTGFIGLIGLIGFIGSIGFNVLELIGFIGFNVDRVL